VKRLYCYCGFGLTIGCGRLDFLVTSLLKLYSVTVVGCIGKPPDYELILLLLLPVVYNPKMLHPVDTFVNVHTRKLNSGVYRKLQKH